MATSAPESSIGVVAIVVTLQGPFTYHWMTQAIFMQAGIRACTGAPPCPRLRPRLLHRVLVLLIDSAIPTATTVALTESFTLALIAAEPLMEPQVKPTAYAG